jgi:hypothetical protein
MSLTKYRLPEVLGGSEVRKAVDYSGGGSWPNHVVVEAYDSAERVTWYVLVPKDALTEVKPPLPEEPAELGWYRWANGESETILRKVEAGGGWSLGRSNGFLTSWKALHETYPDIAVTRLIPAPEPVELPWEGSSLYSLDLAVRLSREGNLIILTAGGVTMTLGCETTREFACALNTAADLAEAQP